MERFWSKVDKHGVCWEWTGCKDRKGYGRIAINGKPVLAHRVAYELERGPIRNGMCVCHTCDNPSCVNPLHLFQGTIADNNRDMTKKGRGHMPKGILSGRAKLTEAQVLEIRAADESHRALAKRYGVSHRVVGRIKTREIWKHL